MDKIGNVTIRKRPNGKYEYRFEIEPVDGKRRWKSKGGFVRKKEAQEAGNKARVEYIRTDGMPERKQENISVNALSEIYLEKIKAKRELTTYASYESNIRNHIRPAIGKMAVKDVDYSDIEKLLQDMADNGSSKSTMEVVKSILSGMFGYAKKPMRLIKYNPVADADIPEAKKEKKERIPYTAEQIDQILELVPPGNDYRLPLILGIYCALRISEALGLTWDCVDLKAGTITIDKQLKPIGINHKTYCALKKPKSKTSIRTIRINSFVKQELLAEKKRQVAAITQYGPYYQHIYLQKLDLGHNKVMEYVVSACNPIVGAEEIQIVCRRQNGTHIILNNVDAFARQISEQLGFRVDTHTGRHTHATLAVEQGAKLPAVAARLGQADIKVTSRYVHETKTMETEALDCFDRALSTAK